MLGIEKSSLIVLLAIFVLLLPTLALATSFYNGVNSNIVLPNSIQKVNPILGVGHKIISARNAQNAQRIAQQIPTFEAAKPNSGQKGNNDRTTLPIIANRINGANGFDYTDFASIPEQYLSVKKCNAISPGSYLLCSLCYSPFMQPAKPVGFNQQISALPDGQTLLDICTVKGATIYQQSCPIPGNAVLPGDTSADRFTVPTLGNSPATGQNNIMAQVNPSSNPIYNLYEYNKLAWCDLELKFTQNAQAEVTNQVDGTIRVSWITNLKSTGKITILNLTEPDPQRELVTVKTDREPTKDHVMIFSGLVPANYYILVDAAVEQTPYTPRQEIHANIRSVQVLGSAVNAATVTFVSPTPADNAILTSDTFTAKISSNKPLLSASIYVTGPDHSVRQIEMTKLNPTSFSVTYSGKAGTNTYQVHVVDSEHEYQSESEVRTATLALPVISFITPTPLDGTVLNEIRTATVTINSNDQLTSAILYWQDTSDTTITYPMTKVNDYTYTATVNQIRASSYSFNVMATDNEGDQADSPTRYVTVTHTPTQPSVNFVDLTPMQGTQLANDSLTVAIESNESLESAWLSVTNSIGTTEYTMTPRTPTRFDIVLNNLHSGANTFRARVIDSQGDTGETTEVSNGSTIESTEIGLGKSFASTEGNPLFYQFRRNDGSTVDMTYGTTAYPGGALPAWYANEASQSNWALYQGNELYSHPGASGGLEYPHPTIRYNINNFSTYTINGTLTSMSSGLVTYKIYVDSAEKCSYTIAGNQTPVNCALGQLSAGQYVEIEEQSTDGSSSDWNKVDLTIFGTSQTTSTSEAGSRTVTVPDYYLLHSFPDEAIGAIGVYNQNGIQTLFAGTYNETVPGKGHVYKSSDATNWNNVLNVDTSHFVDGVTQSNNGVYAMTAMPGIDGDTAFYAGTGTTRNGVPDGDIYRTTDGLHWENVFHGSAPQKVNSLQVIDGTLYAGTTSTTGGGQLVYARPGQTWNLANVNNPIEGVEKYNGNLYYTSNTDIYQLGTEGNGPVSHLWYQDAQENVYSPYGLAMKVYSGKLYAGTLSYGGAVLFSSTDARTWTRESLTETNRINKLRILSDNKLYMPSGKVNYAKLWTKDASDANGLVADFAPSDLVVDVVEFNGNKYVATMDRIGGPTNPDGSTNTNRIGAIYKLTT